MIELFFMLGYLGTLVFATYRWPVAPVDISVIQREIILPALKEFIANKPPLAQK